MRKKVISYTVLLSLLVTACSKYDYSKIPYKPLLTKQEVVDYYAKQMSYDAVVKRSAVKESKIEWNQVPDNIANSLWDETYKVITTHQLNQGYSGEMSRYVHDYLKLTLDDLVLTEPDGGFTYTEAENKGYYFVTVDFKTKLNKLGRLKDEANYVGINGAIIDSTLDGINEIPVLNSGYMESAIIKMNEYRVANRLTPYDGFSMEFNSNSSNISNEIIDNTDAEGNTVIDTVNNDTTLDETYIAEETTELTNDLDTNSENSYEYIDNSNEAIGNKYANNIRQLVYDVKEFNRVVGSANEQIAAVPYIDMVYEPVETEGSLSGYGIFSEGAYGLKDFGYDRSSYGDGSIKITFVFKQNPYIRDKFDYSYCYINEYKTNINLEDKNITQSSYIDDMIDRVIERADRATINKDTSALMSKEIYEASDLGLRELELRNSSNILSFMTKRVKTLDRKDKEYLVELERTSENSPKGFGNTAKYKDKYYAVIVQDGINFKINDIVWVERELLRIPRPNVDDSIVRRLTSLNLAGEVTEQSITEINEMFDKFISGINNKKREDSTNEDGSIEYGIYTRFNNDTSLLNSDKAEYLKSKIVATLNRYGQDKDVKMGLRVTEWLGGYNDQVELETEEIYSYSDIDKGIYRKNYYLVSHYGKDWVIDDIVLIEEKEVSGEELNSLLSIIK